MTEIIGTLESTTTEGNTISDTWRLPAISKRQARLQARANARLKGRPSPNVTSINEIEDGDLPLQSIYRVEMESER
jgi:hypothetical protein